MANDQWLTQDESETSRRFRTHSRRSGLVGAALALATLVFFCHAFFSKTHGAGGWIALAWLTVIAAGPTAVFITVTRLLTLSFRRRIASGRD